MKEWTVKPNVADPRLTRSVEDQLEVIRRFASSLGRANGTTPRINF